MRARYTSIWSCPARWLGIQSSVSFQDVDLILSRIVQTPASWTRLLRKADQFPRMRQLILIPPRLHPVLFVATKFDWNKCGGTDPAKVREQSVQKSLAIGSRILTVKRLHRKLRYLEFHPTQFWMLYYKLFKFHFMPKRPMDTSSMDVTLGCSKGRSNQHPIATTLGNFCRYKEQ